jgi:hypothetical protein
MNRFLIAAALAVTGALAFSDTANAQYSYGYNTVVPGYGVVGNRTFVTPFGTRTVTQAYSPWTGMNRQSLYMDAFGNRATRLNTYNPYLNLGVNRGYAVSPGYFGVPYYRNYGYLYRR